MNMASLEKTTYSTNDALLEELEKRKPKVEKDHNNFLRLINEMQHKQQIGGRKFLIKMYAGGNVNIYDDNKDCVTSYVHNNVITNTIDECKNNKKGRILFLRMLLDELVPDQEEIDENIFEEMDEKKQLINAYMLLRKLRWPSNNECTKAMLLDDMNKNHLIKTDIIKKFLIKIGYMDNSGTKLTNIKKQNPYITLLHKCIQLVNEHFYLTKLEAPLPFIIEKKPLVRKRLSDMEIAKLQKISYERGAYGMIGGTNVNIIGGSTKMVDILRQKFAYQTNILNQRNKSLDDVTAAKFIGLLDEIEKRENTVDEFIKNYAIYNANPHDDGKHNITEDDIQDISSKVNTLTKRIMSFGNGLLKLEIVNNPIIKNFSKTFTL